MFAIGRTAWRVINRDKLEVAKDRTEVNIVTGQYDRIKQLETDNKELMAQLMQKTGELGEVKGEVKALNMQLVAMEKAMSVMQSQIDRLLEQKP